jgi:hypothetical protein
MMAAGFAYKAAIATGALLIAVTSGAAPSVPGARAAATGGVAYAGTTSQGEDVFLILSRNRRQVRRMSIGWVARAARCSNRELEVGSVEVGAPFTRPIRVRRQGRFRAGFRDSIAFAPGQVAALPRGGTMAEDEEVKGRISTSGGKGTFRETVTYRDFAGNVVKRCDTGQLRWKVIQ